ncbi:hypothetical protein MTR_6g035310 [Medicago truncatula]|uniref:Uncharacterized protein n=1 Tax=Medicago truncatula TaxID=3880 RepID=G8A0S7_MEDTR|nr:hypothetical protein MTR_6g035310 [Medicago truncatula]
MVWLTQETIVDSKRYTTSRNAEDGTNIASSIDMNLLVHRYFDTFEGPELETLKWRKEALNSGLNHLSIAGKFVGAYRWQDAPSKDVSGEYQV